MLTTTPTVLRQASRAETPDKITVPNAFDVAPPGIMGRRGTAFYRRNFT